MSASDAPQRDPGLRTRSGNAMLRTRGAILDAAAACVERSGVRRTTMSAIAATGGVAKATLYNHFRTKDDVLAALVEARVAALAAECTGRSIADALEHAAAVLRESAALRRVAQEEPALLVPLA
ncbi:MAG: transcriptional regulator, TetR family, partial [Frankiales bacterium]|nr:transcriptional regulator, TetR family [Frankiales bacterium]